MANLQVQQDVDGLAPGVDTELMGRVFGLTFSGHFYAMPSVPTMKFTRMVRIVFASKEVYVAFDLQHHNLYVVDRAKNLSLGCRMTAELVPA